MLVLFRSSFDAFNVRDEFVSFNDDCDALVLTKIVKSLTATKEALLSSAEINPLTFTN